MNRNINIGVLGLGRLFEKRLNHLFLKETKRVNLVSVFDLNKKKNSKYSKIFNLQKNHSLSEFLQKKYDYVYIATESGNHYKHTILALKNGHNIILEKPPVLKIEDFNNLIKLEKKFRKKIYVVFQNRLNSSVYLFNKKIDNIDPQNILNVSLNLQWSRDKKYYSDWHGKWKMDGGVLAQQGIHYIDLLCFFFGKPIKTIAYCSNKKHKIECEDTITALIQFKSDIVAQVFLTTAMFNKDYEASITVSTNKKIIKISGLCCNEFFEKDLLKKNKFIKNLSYSQKVLTGYGLSHLNVLENIAMKNKKKITKIKDTENTIKLLNMIYLSFEKKRWVYFNENLQSKLGR